MNSLCYYGDTPLSIADAWALARAERQGTFSRTGRARIAASRACVEKIVDEDQAVYGINTGFGPLCHQRIGRDHLQELQYNLLRSHSVGVGAALPRVVVRLMLVLKIQALSLGFSGVSLSLLERLVWHLTEDALPLVPAQGSLGASGDLAPLAHMALPLIGEGELWDGSRYVPAAALLKTKGLQPLVLQPKEGIALINGTQLISAHAVWVLQRFHVCLEQADVLAALSLEGFLGSAQPYAAALHRLRPYAGAQLVASRMRLLLTRSHMLASHANCPRVQDPYSFRCVPQVHGASREAWLHLKTQTLCEINAATDNPLLLPTGRVCSGGNFHGQLLALPMDYATIAVAEIGSISERRSYALSHGGYDKLPKLLLRDTGLHSGFMMPHYTAAALVSENKTLAHPASVDSLPTSLGQEDHVSMGAWGARKCVSVLDNLEQILAIEYLYAAQAIDFRRPRQSSPYLEAAHRLLRDKVAHFGKDRTFAPDIAQAVALLRSGNLLQAVQRTAAARRRPWLPKRYRDFSL